jgi:hypothetical protein
VVVHYQPDLPVIRITLIYFPQEFNEFLTSVTIPYQSVNVAVVKVNASHETDYAKTFVFIVFHVILNRCRIFLIRRP